MDSAVNETAVRRDPRGRKRGSTNNANVFNIEQVIRAIKAARLAGFTLTIDESGEIGLVPVAGEGAGAAG